MASTIRSKPSVVSLTVQFASYFIFMYALGPDQCNINTDKNWYLSKTNFMCSHSSRSRRDIIRTPCNQGCYVTRNLVIFKFKNYLTMMDASNSVMDHSPPMDTDIIHVKGLIYYLLNTLIYKH